MEYRHKGLRARRILKMVEGRESGSEDNNDVEMPDILPFDGIATKVLIDVPTTSYGEQGDNVQEPSLDICELQTVNLTRENSTENEMLSSSGADYIDIINHQLIRTPTSVSNLSFILDNVDFVASPDGYIIHANKSKSNTPTLFDCTIQEDNTILDSDDRNLDETLVPIENNNKGSVHSIIDVKNVNIDINKTLTPQNRSNLSPNEMVTIINSDKSPRQQGIVENEDSVTLQVLGTSESVSLTTISVSGSLPSSSIEPTDDDDNSLSITNDLARKRRRNEKEWIANKSKTLKNSGKAYVGCHSKKQFLAKSVGPSCKCKLKCGETFSYNKRNAILETFYKLGDHELQWQFITKYIMSDSVKKLQVVRNKNRTQTISYYLPSENNKVRVCKVFFLNTLRISEQMVYTAIEKYNSDSDKTDYRGKHNNRPRKMSVPTEESIISHIKLFPVKEAHYVRKSSKRKYLCETLNISKMYRLYTDWFKEQTVMNAKQTGEKYKVKEMRQDNFYDIKSLITGQNWLNDAKGNKIYWSKIKEIKVAHTHPQSVYFKYDYDDDYIEMNIRSTTTKNTRKRKSASTAATSSIADDVTLQPAYNGPVPISKALHEDLSSLCRINAIPLHYHSFYKSLISTNNTEAVLGEDDCDSESNETD
ncbi:unnamed protein product, partial [Brenthis ino]